MFDHLLGKTHLNAESKIQSVIRSKAKRFSAKNCLSDIMMDATTIKVIENVEKECNVAEFWETTTHKQHLIR